MNIIAITMIVVLVIYGIVGLFMMRKIRNADSFYIMEQKAPTLFLVCGICMAYVSGVTMISGAGVCYEKGPLLLLSSAPPGAWLGIIVAILFIGRKMKSIGCYTMPDYFAKRFSDNNVTFLATLIMGLGLGLYGVGQLIAIGDILSDVTGLSYEWLILIFTLAIILFCVPGGIWGIMMTDVVMFVVVFVGTVVVCPMILYSIAPEAVANLPAQFWELGGMDQLPIGYNLSQFFLWFTFFAGSPVIITRIFPAKNDFAVFKACAISVALIGVICTLTYLTAGMMQGVDPNIAQSEKVMLHAYWEHAPKLFGLIGIAGILTAAMSTAAIVFELTGFALSRDLYGLLNPDKQKGRESITRARLAQFFVVAIGGAIAYFQPVGNFDISMFVCGIFAASWLPVLVLSLLWKRYNSSAAFYSMLTGLVSLTLLQLLISFRGLVLPLGLNQYVISVAVSIMVSVLLSLFHPAKGSNAVNYFRIQNTLPSDMILTTARKTKNALPQLFLRYKRTRWILVTTLGLTVVFWLIVLFFFGGAM